LFYEFSTNLEDLDIREVKWWRSRLGVGFTHRFECQW